MVSLSDGKSKYLQGRIVSQMMPIHSGLTNKLTLMDKRQVFISEIRFKVKYMHRTMFSEFICVNVDNHLWIHYTTL